MPRFLVATLVGLLVAYAIGIGLNLLLVSAGASSMETSQVVGFGVGAFVAMGIMSAAGRKPAQKAQAGEKAAALGSPPPAGTARLTVFREGAVGSRNGTDLFLDGREAVQLQGGQFTSLALPPGRHTVRVALAGAANAGSKPAELTLDLAEGATNAMRVTLAMKLTTSDVVLTPVDASDAARRLSGRTMVTARPLTATAHEAAMPGGEADGLTGLSAGWRLGPLILARAHSSMRLSLVLEAQGLSYRVLRPSTWAYEEIDAIDLRRMPVGVRIGFQARGGGRFLWADFDSMRSARRFLLRLPASVALKPRAAEARDSDA